MKNRLKSSLLATLYLLTGCSSLYGVVVWNNISAPSVVDDDIHITTSVVNLAPGGTIIEAINQDILVTINAGTDVDVKGVEFNFSQIYLKPHAGRKITFRVNKNLSFLGASLDTIYPLLIAQGDQGQVVWEIAGGNKVTFGSPSNGSGTEYYLFLQDGTDAPKATFTRDPNESANDLTQHTYINVGTQSLLGYVSTQPIGDSSVLGLFTFDPSTTEKGLMELQIEDQGAVLIYPRAIVFEGDGSSLTDITIAQIQKNRLAGGVAELEVANVKGDPAHASLFIANKNQTMPEFWYDPFLNLDSRNDLINYSGSFAGNQYGFIVGSNGILSIFDNANVHYVGLDINRDISVSQVPEVPGYPSIPIGQLIKQRNPSALFCDQSLNPAAFVPTVTFGDVSALYLRSGVGTEGTIRELVQQNPYTVDEDEQNTGVGYYLLDLEGQADFIGLDNSGGQKSKIEVLSLEVEPTGGALLLGGIETNCALRTFKKHLNGKYYLYNPGVVFVNGYLKIKNVSLVHSDLYSDTRVIPEDDIFSYPTYIGGETFKLLKLDIDPLSETVARPKIAFESTQAYFHSSAAVTGVDLLVPAQVESDDNAVPNLSRFVFCYNGYTIDQGTGRTLILGTSKGSFAMDELSDISKDAHLDVIQTYDALAIIGADPLVGDHRLRLEVAPNDATIVEDITGDIEGVNSQHLIYLGHNSNISVGTNKDAPTGFDVDTHAHLQIAGNYFAIQTDGGLLNDARSSARTGTGGIFVDYNGRIEIQDIYNAFIGTMVSKSRNGIVDLPFENIQFAKQVGVTDWGLSFNVGEVLDEYSELPAGTNNPVIVGPIESYTDYTIDWLNIKKDPGFIPYQGETNSLSIGRGRVVLPNQPTPISPANYLNIPTIQGEIIQLQISGSPLGNPAHILIDGGYVHELVFVNTTPDPLPGEAPVAVIFLQNGGRVGLGGADRNSDSAQAAVTLGRNGVIIVSNGGDNEVILNNSVVVNGDGPFLFGPDAASGDVLRVSSEVDDAIVVRKGAALDLRSVNNGKILEIGGQLSVEMESNTKIIFSDGNTVLDNGWNKGIIRFVENTQLNISEHDDFEEVFDVIPLGSINNELDPLVATPASNPHNQYAPLTGYGLDRQNTDSFRIRIIGAGNIAFYDKASCLIPYRSVVGVETYIDSSEDVDEQIIFNKTDIVVDLNDASHIYLGNLNYQEGGVLQIGNVIDRGPDNSISFTLNVNGQGSRFITGSKSVLGLNAVVVKATQSSPTDLLVNTAFNVDAISINVNDGALDMSRIYDTDDSHANVVIIGDNTNGTPLYTFAYAEVGSAVDTTAEIRAQNATVLGGSPIVYLKKGDVDAAVSPIVREDDGAVQVATDGDDQPINSERIEVGMLASTLLQNVASNDVAVVASTLFDQLKTPDAYEGDTVAHDKANAADEDEEFRDSLESIRVGTVAAGKLIRQSVSDVFTGVVGGASAAAAQARKQATEIGAVFADISSALSGFAQSIISVAQMPF